MRTAVYARVSTEEQVEGYSIDAQLRGCRAIAEEKGWNVVAEYVDEGRSARTEDISKRPQFKRMIEDAKRNLVDVVVVHKLDRFSRNLRVTFEYLDLLDRQRIGFVSVSEQMDFSTPMGKVILANLAAFAQFYSDNLSMETKKGWAERRDQGLYCGLLPFAAMKGEDGVPVLDPDAYPGLKLAFELSAQGQTDRQVAQALSLAGYRTAGNQGNRPFSKDTVRGILTNRFYRGYIPDGDGGWIGGKHEPFVDEALWEQVQRMRERNKKSTHVNCPTKGRVASLTGVALCWRCKGRIHVSWSRNGKVRLGCYTRAKGWGCQQRSGALDVYALQIRGYLETFEIPEDYRRRILEAHVQLRTACGDADRESSRLETQLRRIKVLYEWGDLSREEYRQKRDALQHQLQSLSPPRDDAGQLERLAHFLASMVEAWDSATQEQRNKPVRCLFDEVWLKDKAVVAVKPRMELEPFFRLNYEAFVNQHDELATPMGIGATMHNGHSSPRSAGPA